MSPSLFIGTNIEAFPLIYIVKQLGMGAVKKTRYVYPNFTYQANSSKLQLQAGR